MNTAQPIRSEQELKDFMNFYRTGTVSSEKSTAAYDGAEYRIKNFGSSFFTVEAGI